jgi:ATP-dependent DNA ligase
MLAKATGKIPVGDFLYEPKWDGFRTIVFRDGDELYLQSRDSKPLLRYFPELREPLLAQLPERCVVDGELVIVTPEGLDFDSLQMRLHPAKSRIDLLAGQIPARFVAFDLLALGDEDLRGLPFADRRAALQRELASVRKPVHLTPATNDIAVAKDWFERFEGAGFDGVVAKPLAEPYAPNKRTMIKVKHERTADSVVAGFRWHKQGEGTLVGSLILALYGDDGDLHQIGVAASFDKKMRAQLVEELAPLRADIGDHPWAEWAGHSPTESRPGVQSRWSQGRDLHWEALRIERVAEVAYNHFDGRRFRHPVQFKRWRPDKPPSACRFDQMETSPPAELAELFG